MKIVKICVLLVGLGSVPLQGQRITLDTLSLYRLPGVWVQVDSLPSAAVQDGLVADTLRVAIERALGEARIRVFTQSEWQNTLGNPLLGLSVNLLRVSDFLYLYNIELELHQLSTLPRDSVPVFGATWTAGDVLGSVSAANLPGLRDHVTQMVERFIRAYDAARDYQRPWIRPREDDGGGIGVVSSAGGRNAVASRSKMLKGLTEMRP